MDSAQTNASVYHEPVQQKKKGISGSTVKIIAVTAMLIDHVAAALLTRMITTGGYYRAMVNAESYRNWMAENGWLFSLNAIMRSIGRLGFPIFCFLLVEGFQKTRSVKKYAFRLGLFALISEIPFDLAFNGRVWYPGYQNVYFTLLIGILALWAFDIFSRSNPAKKIRGLVTAGGILLPALYGTILVRRFVLQFVSAFLAGFTGKAVERHEVGLPVLAGIYLVLVGIMLGVWLIYRKARGDDRVWRMCGDLAVLAAAMAAADMLQTDYSGMGVLTIAVMYALRKNKVLSMTGGCVTLTIMSISEIPAFLALIPIARYNGERGLKMKYFFYAFYPVHLFLIWLICWAMGMGWTV